MESRTYLGSIKRQFISIDRIEALIINEGITFHTVIFYMAIVLKEKPQMVLLFEVRSLRLLLNLLLKTFSAGFLTYSLFRHRIFDLACRFSNPSTSRRLLWSTHIFAQRHHENVASFDKCEIRLALAVRALPRCRNPPIRDQQRCKTMRKSKSRWICSGEH